MIKILGIKIIDRIKEAGLTQAVLSKYAHVITTRLGFHEVTDAVCSREAYIILHLSSKGSETEDLASELKTIGGVEIRELSFSGEDIIPESVKESSGIEILCILTERDQEVISSAQRIFTAYGCNIRTRLGLNETFYGQPAGLIILELTGDNDQRILLERDLKALKKVHVRSMTF